MGKTSSSKSVGLADVKVGKNFKFINPVNIYGCEIGDDVFVGPFVEIQRNVVIGHRTKVQSHSFLCELVTIGSDCFIGHGVMFVNDLFKSGAPAGGDKLLWGSTNVGHNVCIGSNSTVLPVSICSNVVIGAGSVVVKDITEPGIYAGNPVRLFRRIPSKR